MKYSHKLSDAVHILAFVDIFQDGDLSSKMIASSVESNPSLIRRLMSLLKKAGLLSTQPGTVAPKLSRPASDISLLDIYQALDEERNLLHIDPKTNPNCLVGGNIQETLDEAYARVQNSAEKEMSQITLQSIIDGILDRHAKKTAKK